MSYPNNQQLVPLPPLQPHLSRSYDITRAPISLASSNQGSSSRSAILRTNKLPLSPRLILRSSSRYVTASSPEAKMGCFEIEAYRCQMVQESRLACSQTPIFGVHSIFFAKRYPHLAQTCLCSKHIFATFYPLSTVVTYSLGVTFCNLGALLMVGF